MPSVKSRLVTLLCAASGVLLLAAPTQAKDSLGIFSDWGAFRDTETARCYAIAQAAPSTQQRDNKPFASIGTWPKRSVRNQIHLRLSRNIQRGAKISLTVGSRRFTLTGAGGNAWAQNQTMDAGIVSSMRSATKMVVRSKDSRGRNFSNTYALTGAATAMDAATVGCSSIR
jgi:hypothetical protein